MSKSNENMHWIEIERIDEDVENHRLVTDIQSDGALLESILANGVQQPIKLCEKANGRYTLVFGFRRKAAAFKAGLKKIPAIVVSGLTPSDIRSLQAIENLERKELHPLEEARFVQDLGETLAVEHLRDDEENLVQELAARIGRTPKWVENRMALGRLSPRVRQAFLDGDIQLQHAQLIGRLVSHDAQEEVLGSVRGRYRGWLLGSHVKPREREEAKDPPSTIAETRRLVEARLNELAGVPWKLDAAFDGKIACTECPHNSANRLDLFDGDSPKKPTCLNAPCYKEKHKFAGRAVQRATNTALKTADKVTPATARKAIKEREVEFVTPKAVTAAAQRRQAPATQTTGSERRGMADWERHRKIMNTLRERTEAWLNPIIEAIDAKLPYSDPDGIAMIALINQSGLLGQVVGRGKKTAAAREKLRKALVMLKEPAKLDELVRLLASDIRGQLTGRRAIYNHPLELNREHFNDAHGFTRQALCEIFDIPVEDEKPTAKAVERELFPPEPKAAKKKTRKKATKKRRKKAVTA